MVATATIYLTFPPLSIISTGPKPANGRQGLVGSWGQNTDQVGTLGRGADNQNGNLRWHLPLGPPPPLMAQISRHFFTPLFSFAIESYIYETDFTLKKYHF